MKILLLVFSIVFFGSCAFHSGQFESDLPNEPVEHRDIAKGEVSTVKVFGIGSTNRNRLIQQARQQMISNRPLTKDESYNNTVIDVKTTYILCVVKRKVTITADVIAPKENVSDPTYTEKYLDLIVEEYVYDSLFQIGDSVIYGLDNFGEVIGFKGKGNDKVRIQYTTESGETKETTRNGKNVFVLLDDYRGNRVPETRKLGPTIAFGVKGDIVKGPYGHIYYGHNE